MIIEKAKQLLENHEICDHCLGRMFGLLGKSENYIRGKSIRLILNMEREINGESPILEPPKCELCEGVFKKVDHLARMCYEKASKMGLEFETFLVGSRFPKGILEKEQKIMNEFDLKYAELINRELNREIGKILEIILQKQVNKENPDVVFIIEPYTERIELQIKPLHVYGRYRKLVRGIPQTPLKGFKESVASIICRPFSKATGGKCVFHGAGREDIDVRMLGNGRPFVVEVKRPIKRKINLKEIAEEINRSGKVEVLDLECISAKKAEKVLTPNHKKEYEALVCVEEGISREEVENVVKALKRAEIHQMTPRRVLGRRVDLVRIRRIHEIEGELIDEKHFKLRLITDGGLYIKELISGDGGRTIPSVKEVLRKNAWCEKLDVLNILDGE